jgi:hypothetical protein
MLNSSSVPSVGSDQVLIDRIQIVINRSDRFDLKPLLRDQPVKQQIEIVRPSRLNKQAFSILVYASFDGVLIFEQPRS